MCTQYVLYLYTTNVHIMSSLFLAYMYVTCCHFLYTIYDTRSYVTRHLFIIIINMFHYLYFIHRLKGPV